MKLSEFLENANYKFIKIGTCGSSFLYCGSLKNLDTKAVDKSYRKYLRKRRNERYKKKLKDYKPIAKRDVIEAYDSALYRDCIIVIVDGNERGNVEDL